MITYNEKNYISDKTFENKNSDKQPLVLGDYENCIFNNCSFYNCNLSNYSFEDCEFINCNLSMVNLNKTGLRNIRFKDCKMLGIDFENCNDFGLFMQFENCVLNDSSFYKKKIKKTTFKDTLLKGVDFTECDLSGSIFAYCDFMNAVFDNTLVEKCDFRTSFHYSIDPERNKISKAKFSILHIAGLLNKYDIEIENIL